MRSVISASGHGRAQLATSPARSSAAPTRTDARQRTCRARGDSMSYPITASGTDADEAKKLTALRIRTTERLLEAAKNPKGRKELAEKTGIYEKRLLCLSNTADRM